SAKNKKRKRKIKIKEKQWLNNYMDATNHKDIDLVVELIGGAEGPAKKLVFNALKNKKHVVTANKALIAKYGDQLAKIAEKNKVNLEFEAAVCGGVPIIRSLKEGLIANKISKIYGIFNGTSNYILSTMDKKNKSFNEVLNTAKKLGYAESNPSSDLNGDDVSAKLKILTSLCFNSFLNDNIYVEGIKNIDKNDINYANKFGYKIKLLGYSELVNKKIYQRVHPTLIRKSSYVASIDGVLNAVIVDGSPVGQSIIQGEGAGPLPTTSALISDISSILRGNVKFPFSLSEKERKKLQFNDISNRLFSAYVRFDVLDKPGILSKITNIFSKNKVSIKRLVQDPNKLTKTSSIAIITHSSKDEYLKKIIKVVSNKNFIIKKPKLIRIDEN
ncbi:homoserine dehydrogenase, partial [Pelagibacteraceae bacterium]|nr:homoserine dehydrogenase [Pelagibacteraceae bacterium]